MEIKRVVPILSLSVLILCVAGYAANRERTAAAVRTKPAVGYGGEKAASVTARQIVERIKRNVTCEWQKRTVDTFKAGDTDAPITGVAVTFITTLDVLKRAKASGLNFVITHEPTFYHGQDDTTQLEGDPVLRAKRQFIRDNGLIIWRFHDHWHSTAPDGIVTGMIESLGWRRYVRKEERLLFEVPQTSVREFAMALNKEFGTSPVRVVGKPEMKFSRFALAVGAPPSIMQMKLLQREDVEVLVAGETREWETVEYVRDAAAAGKHKALILLGHCNSEEAGMEYCARWLREFVPEIPVRFVPAGDPFWSP